MMIDFALEAERDEGLPPREAIFKACLLRFRPIMMTTMAALLGGLPLALGTGTGAELRRPLGITIVGGLLSRRCSRSTRRRSSTSTWSALGPRGSRRASAPSSRASARR